MMEKINVAELLRDCPNGMELDCVMFDTKITYQRLSKRISTHPIVVQTEHGFEFELTQYGQIHNFVGSKCVIFPKGKTTWEGFVPPCKFKDGDILYLKTVYEYECIFINKIIKTLSDPKYYKYANFNEDSSLIVDDFPITYKNNVKEIRFATEEEKEKLFEAIKANGYKWNSETKTLDKLIEFKDGDILADVHGNIAIYKGPIWYNKKLADYYCGYRKSDNHFQ